MKKALLLALLLAPVCSAQKVVLSGKAKQRGKVISTTQTTSTYNFSDDFARSPSACTGAFPGAGDSVPSPWDGCTSSATHVGTPIIESCPGGQGFPSSSCYMIWYGNGILTDINLYLRKSLPNVTHFYMEMYWSSDLTVNAYGQRKILYPKNVGGFAGYFFLTSFTSASPLAGCNSAGNMMLQLTWIGSDGSEHNTGQTPSGVGCNMAFSTAYRLGVEVQQSSVFGASDGYVNLWVNGVKDTNLSASSQNVWFSAAGLTVADVGAQLEPAGNEKRHFTGVKMKWGTFTCGVSGC